MATKVGFFVISTHLGGAERSLLDLLSELKKSNSPLHVYLPRDQGPLIDELQQQQIPWTSLDWPDWFLSLSRKKNIKTLSLLLPSMVFSLKSIGQLQAIIEKDQLTHVHSTGLKFHILFKFVAKRCPEVEFVLHIRDIIASGVIKKILVKGRLLKNLRFLSNSKITARSLAPLTSKVIYNGFSLPPQVHFNLKQQLGLSDKLPLVGVVGAIARWKGQREFINMAALIHQQHPGIQYVIVGSEIYDTHGDRGELFQLKKKVRELQLQDVIHFLPFQKDMTSVYAGIDVLVHASINPEPFGRVIVESMMSGCPVTASNLGGPQEIIEPLINGLLHSPGHVSSMAENVLKLLNNPDLNHKIKENGQTRARDFSLHKHVCAMKKELGLSELYRT